MSTLKNCIKKHPIWFGTIGFALLSLVCNLVWIALFDMAHIYDVIHVIPTIFIYEPIVEMLGGFAPTELIFVPLAVLIDGIFGGIFALILSRLRKEYTAYILGMIAMFAIYWIVITYQWLPIL